MKKLLKVLIIFVFSIFFTKGVYAASSSLSASSTKVNKGQSVTITASVNNVASWNMKMSASGGSLSGKTASADTSDDGNGVSMQVMSAKFSANVAGTYTISLTGQLVDENLKSSKASGTVTITVVEPEEKKQETATTSTGTTSNQNNNQKNKTTPNNTNNTNNNNKSSNANLSNLGINPNDFKGFNPSVTTYDVIVPNETTSVEVYANAQNKNSTISGIGKKELKEGLNSINIIVTAEDGTSKTYTINLTRQQSNSTENEVKQEEVPTRLEQLKIEGCKLNPEFNSEIYEYNVEFTGDLNKLNIEAQSNNENAKINIIGNENLIKGNNTIEIQVTDPESDKTLSYIINVNKIENEENRKDNKYIFYIIVVVALIIVIAVLVLIINNRKKGQ